MVQKQRVNDVARSLGPYPVYADGSKGTRSLDLTTNLLQTTDSEGHPFQLLHKQRDGNGMRDIGGSFHTRRFYWKPEYREKRFTLNAYYGGGIYYADGHIHVLNASVANFNDLANAVPAITGPVMDSWGATAVSQVIPTKSKVDLAVSAVELAREGLPKIIGQGLLKSVIKDHRKVGSHIREGAGDYLNYEFGIKPLIGDIQGISKSIVEAATRLKQLERDSGRLVRRKFAFPVREETFQQSWSGNYPSGWSNTYLWRDYQRNTRVDRVRYETKRWFSGAFTYHLDLGERHRNQLYEAADNARLLLGVKLDAEVLWNLAPWSWLADWFGNVGDIMTNVSHFSRDGLVMPYGYLMAQQTASRKSVSKLHWSDPAGPPLIVDEISYVRKQRQPANPFGFGLSDMMLDSRQTSILAALGITRVPRK